MCHPCNENKGADQLRSYCEADLRLCFRLCKLLFSYNAAHFDDLQSGYNDNRQPESGHT